MRINKFLAETGQCSRRKADRLIEDGRVVIKNRLAKLGDQVEEGDVVKVDGKTVLRQEQFVYIAFNKPFGVITTMDKRSTNSVADYVKLKGRRVFPFGRLDVESSGLLLFTDDGDLAHKVTHAKFGHEKEYVVSTTRPIDGKFMNKMAAGIELDGKKTLPAHLLKLGPVKFQIVLTEGRNRQIRRMCESLGYQVKKLNRIRVANIKLESLPAGRWRFLSTKEVSDLKKI